MLWWFRLQFGASQRNRVCVLFAVPLLLTEVCLLCETLLSCLPNTREYFLRKLLVWFFLELSSLSILLRLLCCVRVPPRLGVDVHLLPSEFFDSLPWLPDDGLRIRVWLGFTSFSNFNALSLAIFGVFFFMNLSTEIYISLYCAEIFLPWD